MPALDYFERRALDSYLTNDKNFRDISNTPKYNTLINVDPTRIASPYDNNDVIAYSSKSANISPSTIYDPATGLLMAKATFAIGETAQLDIDWNNIPIMEMGPNDVWMVSFYLPERIANIDVLLTIDTGVTVSSSRRIITLDGETLQKGYNLVSLLNVETGIGATTYDILGTSARHSWENIGAGSDSDSIFKSVRLSTRLAATEAAEVNVHLGSIFTAPAKWAKAAIMWGADDLQNSFLDLAVPVLESYGWPYFLAPVSSYTADPPGDQATIARIRQAARNGNEIWSHTRRHEDVAAADAAGKIKALVPPTKFFTNQGLADAAKFIMWPGGSYDDASVTAAKDAGYILGGSIDGDEINPYLPAVNPFNISRFAIEQSNPWKVDAQLNGCILRGGGLISYGHGAVAGGTGLNVYPEANRFYLDHFKRWCELVARHEADGRVVVTTPLRYFKMCGIDPYANTFVE